MGSDFHPLQDYLRNVYRNLNVVDAVDNVDAVAAYRKVVGDFINKLTFAVSFRNGVLYVGLSSGALRNELSFKRQALVDRINAELGRPLVRNIVFK